MNTAKKSVYNILFGVLGQIVTIAVGILLPRLFITSYGSQVNGFLSSVNQFFAYLTLLEAGVGAVTVQALYAPISRGDTDKINGIMAATDRLYRRTAIFYAIGVVVLAAIFPLVVKSEISLPLQVGCILLIGGSGVVSYLFQAKYKLLLQAEGKQYVLSNIGTVSHLIISVSKLVLILVGMSFIWLQAAQLLVTGCFTLYYAIYISRHYPKLSLKVTPDEKALEQKNAALIHNIANMVFNHTDVLLLTLILQDLKVVSVYVLYSGFVDMISTLISNINTGFVYRLGQLYNTERERYLGIFDCYETYYMAISFGLYAVTLMFLYPFMELYTEGITDANYLLPLLPVLFVSYKLLVSGRAACGAAISYAGHFKNTQMRSVIEAVINLTVSIVGVIVCEKLWGRGIYGVLLGTIAALIYRAVDMILYANRRVLCRSCSITLKKCGINLVLFVGLVLAFNALKLPLTRYRYIILFAAIATVVTLTLYIAVNSLFYPKAFQIVWGYVKELFARFKSRKKT